MKTTKSFFATAVTALAILTGSANSMAQTAANDGDSKATRLGIGISAGIPTTEGYRFGFGGDLRLQQDFTSNVSGVVSVGYNTFSLKPGQFSAAQFPSGADIPDNLDYIPLKAGVKVFPTQRLYFSAEIGAGFPIRDGAKTAFIYAPGIGVGTNLGLDIGLRYEGMTGSANLISLKNPGQVALRLAYGFSL